MSLSDPDNAPVLIIGAAGGQGGAAARACLARGMQVRAFVRDASAPAAGELLSLGAELVPGDLASRETVEQAVQGVRAVFSVQPENAPIAWTENLCASARAAGVTQFVQSTVSGTGLHEATPGWSNPALWPEYWEGRHPYWEHKQAQEQAVRTAGFTHWSLVRPPMIIDNAVKYAAILFPRLASDGCIVSCVPEEIAVPYISYASIGAAVAQIMRDPATYSGATLEIADEELTDAQLAHALTEGTGKPVTALHVDAARARELGVSPRIVTQHLWLGEIGYPARSAAARRYGLTPVPIAEWAKRNAAHLVVGDPAKSPLLSTRDAD